MACSGDSSGNNKNSGFPRDRADADNCVYVTFGDLFVCTYCGNVR
jgi:hypothetical protein